MSTPDIERLRNFLRIAITSDGSHEFSEVDTPTQEDCDLLDAYIDRWRLQSVENRRLQADLRVATNALSRKVCLSCPHGPRVEKVQS